VRPSRVRAPLVTRRRNVRVFRRLAGRPGTSPSAPDCFPSEVHGIDVEHESGAVVVSAHGELDAYSAPALGEAFANVRSNASGNVLIDLTRVSFMDSTALGLVVRAVNGVVDDGGRACLVLPESSARRIFEITTLDRVLPVASSRAEALRELTVTNVSDGDGEAAED
jgi:anti-sigma B factor antagonist